MTNILVRITIALTTLFVNTFDKFFCHFKLPVDLWAEMY